MRQTSDVTDTDFPFAEDSTAFILVFEGESSKDTKDGRGFEHASTFDKKKALVETALEWSDSEVSQVTLLAVWPGATRSDVFLVDDLEEALAAF